MRTRPVLPLVISMALPMTISMLVNALYNIVDSFFVAKISDDAMTALSLVYPIQNLMMATTVGFGIGINAMIAYFLGAKREKEANISASVGVVCNIFHGLLLTIGCILVMPAFLKMFTKDATIIDLGLQYSNIVFLFAIPVPISISLEKIFQSVGRMRTSMFCMIIGCIANVVLDPLLIFGIGVFPKMGIEGAAIATGVGEMVTLAGYIIIYFVKPISVRINICYVKFRANILKRMYAIGVPATLNMALPSLQISVLNGILAVYSSAYVLVLGAYFKLQTFLYLTANGVVQGMRPLLAYNYGAGEKKRVNQIYKTALRIIAGVMVVGTLLCMSVPDKFIGLFTNNAQTIKIGQNALRMISLGFVVSSVSVTASGALEGLGKGVRSLVISLMRYLLIMLPAAFILSRSFGPSGVWSAFWITEFITAVVAHRLYAQCQDTRSKKSETA